MHAWSWPGPRGRGGRYQSRSSSAAIRPSADYEHEWRNREYGGEDKQRRAEERKRQAALKAQGTNSSPNDLHKSQAPMNQSRLGQQLCMGSTHSWNDRVRGPIGTPIKASSGAPVVAPAGAPVGAPASWNDRGWAHRRCGGMPENDDCKPVRLGSSTISDAAPRDEASFSEKGRHPGRNILCQSGSDAHEEADRTDASMQRQLHIVKLAFDATAYGSGCLSLSPGELLKCTSNEQNGWIRGHRWPPRNVTGSGGGAAQEGWYPADFTEPWPDRACVDANGFASVGVDSFHAAATMGESLGAAAGKPRKTPQIGVAIDSFDGTQYGIDYMSLNAGDIVAYDGVEEGGWLLGRCINCDNGEVLQEGWYPQGFTQSLPEAAQAAADLELPPVRQEPTLQETQAKASIDIGALEGVAAVEDLAEEPDAEQPPAPAA